MDNQSYYQQPGPGQMMGQPVSQQPFGPQPTAPVQQNKLKGNTGAVASPWMIIAIVAGLAAATFIALFIWMYVKWNSAQGTVDSQVNAAVAQAVYDKTAELEVEFSEREKSPYIYFSGPADYGQLSFEYPKTWSLYEAQSADTGGDYEAYLNPGVVYAPNNNTVTALRVLIKNQAYDDFIKQYEGYLKDGRLSVEVRVVNGENANVYSGELPGTDKLQGIVAILRIRDKTAVLQTDSSQVFGDDFYRILDSVQYNL